ncbi:hypothetical protein JYQ62_28280 [Nostoc sp. UHCC 0702]|nr:hypothetical protein JYQ62_28280 [Nostoc sp. UHCC 0702]
MRLAEIKWRKRWRKQHEGDYRKQAPKWWAEFFIQEFGLANSESVLYGWGKLIELINFAFHEDSLQKLRQSYSRGLGTGDWGHNDHAVVERSRNSVHRWVKSLCLEKFRSASAAAGTPVALGRKRDCSHWLDFSLCV